VCVCVCVSSGGFKEEKWRRPSPSLLTQNFFSISHRFPYKRQYSSLCAFAINDDGDDTLSSVPFINFWIHHCASHTEYSDDDVFSWYFDGSSSNKVDGIENVSRVNERVAWRSVSWLELHRQRTQTTWQQISPNSTWLVMSPHDTTRHAF